MPPDSKSEPEIIALQAVYAALKPLTPELRNKVLASVYALLGINSANIAPPLATSLPQLPTADTAASVADQGNKSASRPLAINELMQQKKPGTSAQRITLFAYYRDKHENLARFKRNDLEAYFGKAKESPPANYDRDFVEAVKKGWIHEDRQDSYITSKGIEVVESNFAGERKRREGGKAGRKSKASGRRRKSPKRASVKANSK